MRHIDLKKIDVPLERGSADGQIVRWNNTTKQWEPVTGASIDGSGNLVLPGSVSAESMILSDNLEFLDIANTWISTASNGLLFTASGTNLYFNLSGLYPSSSSRLLGIAQKLWGGLYCAKIIDDGTQIRINGAAAPTANGTGVMAFAQASADPTPASNTACIYAKDNGGTVEMRVCDEAGNVQDISPHTNLAPAWMYDDVALGIMCSITESIQYYIGKVVYEAHSREKYLAGLTSAERDALPVEKRKCLHVETFAEHELRTGRKLVKWDWSAVQEAQRLRRDQEVADTQTKLAELDAQIADAKDEKAAAELTAEKEAIAVPEAYTKKPVPTRIAALTAEVIKEPIKQLP